MPSYRLNQAIVAIAYAPAGSQFVRIPTGTTIEIAAGHAERGLINIIFEHRALMVFVEDLLQRGQRVEE